MALLTLSQTAGGDAAHPDAALAGAKRYIYLEGSDILAPLYSDENLTHLQANPMVANDQGVFDLAFLPEDLYRVVTLDAKHQPIDTMPPLQIGPTQGLTQGLAQGHHFTDTAALLADTRLSYQPQTGHLRVFAGTLLSIPTAGLSYRVLGPEAPDAHLITEGGVQLEVLPGDSGFDVRAFGARGDGTTDDTAACQACLDAAALQQVTARFPAGRYLVTSLHFGPQQQIVMDRGGCFLAAEDNRSVLVCTEGYFSTVTGVRVEGNGRSAVTAFDLSNLRHSAEVRGCHAQACAVGFHFRQLCWNTTVSACYAKACDIGYLITEGSNAVTLLHCASDGHGALSPTAGVRIRDGASYATEGVNLLGGFHQATGIGVDDAGTNSKIIGVYFETCTEADILLGGRFPCIDTTHHSSETGPVCVKGRSCQAASIDRLALTGTRSLGLFDFDDSNSNCTARKVETAGENTVLGETAGVSVLSNAFRGNAADELGLRGAPEAGYALTLHLDGGGDLAATSFGSSAAFGSWRAGKAVRWNAPQSHRFYSGPAGSESEQLRIEAGIVTLYGQCQAGHLPMHADEVSAAHGGLPSGRLYRTSTGELRVKL